MRIIMIFVVVWSLFICASITSLACIGGSDLGELPDRGELPGFDGPAVRYLDEDAPPPPKTYRGWTLRTPVVTQKNNLRVRVMDAVVKADADARAKNELTPEILLKLHGLTR